MEKWHRLGGMPFFLGFGLCSLTSLISLYVASKRAPEMAFDQATHPVRECEIIELPLHRTQEQDLGKAA